MAAGLPLVTSNVHGINDYSQNGVTGYTCCPNDAAAFTLAIEKLIDNPEERLRMAAHNPKAARAFDLSVAMKAMADIYRV
jgi:glycosyltransferase involved in cell wall biosynthesis